VKYFLPQTVDDALSLAIRQSKAKYYAGGTDVQRLLKHQLSKSETIIDLSRISELKHIRFQKKGDLQIGALVTLAELVSHPELQEKCPLISMAAQSVASPIIRKSATLGGNLLAANRCTFYNQSLEWRQAIGSCLRDTGEICQVTKQTGNCYSRNISDLAPALIALGARITLHGPNGSRSIALEDLYTPDGIHYHQGLNSGELLTEISIPIPEGKTWYRKLRVRRSIDFSSLTRAALTKPDGAFRVCVNAVSMAPVLLQGDKNQMSLEDLQTHFRKHCKTVNNDLVPLHYRRTMLFNWLEEWWNSDIADSSNL